MAVTIRNVKRKPARAATGALEPEHTRSTHQTIGEDNLFETLFKEHWNRVCGVVYRLVGDPDEAEDLALEVFWRLHRRPPRDLNLAGWLYRVATHLGINALRSRKRRKRYEEEAGILEFTRNAPLDPAAEVENAEQRQAVQRILAEMNPRSAQILVMRHSGLSYAEIAAALRIAPASVGTLLARAEREFEKRYQDFERR